MEYFRVVKYFICVKEPKTKDKDIDTFIDLAFNKKKINRLYRYDYTNYNVNLLRNDIYNYDNVQGYNRRYLFTKGNIYHTTDFSEDYIIDDAGNSHKITIELMECFKKYDFKLDDITNKVVHLKQSKGDTIEIMPFHYRFDTKKTVYSVKCSIRLPNNLINTRQTLDYSPLEGIIYCYGCLRELDERTRFLKRCLEGKAYKKTRINS